MTAVPVSGAKSNELLAVDPVWIVYLITVLLSAGLVI